MRVFAFDRDETLSVNPPPEKKAVPIEWVRHIAHHTNDFVYAIGNQKLVEEANIYGVLDIVGRHPTADWNEQFGDKLPNGEYERFPSRYDRLDMITEIHPDAEQYIVVDDFDLSNASEWTHYFAWDFYEAVKEGEIEIGVDEVNTKNRK